MAEEKKSKIKIYMQNSSKGEDKKCTQKITECIKSILWCLEPWLCARQNMCILLDGI